MRNLKKFLALVLAMMMVMGLMVTANAAKLDDLYADGSTVSAKYATAVNVLTQLKIFQGTSGDFNPTNTLTRGEAAKLVYRVMTGDTNDSQEDLYATYGEFIDVQETHYAAAAINFAANGKIVVGDGQGNFFPDVKVNGYQLLAIMLRAIGYGKNGEYQGDEWEVNTLIAANRLGLTKGITGIDLRQPIERQVVAQILYNSVNVPLVHYTQGLDYIEDYEDTHAGLITLAPEKTIRVNNWGAPFLRYNAVWNWNNSGKPGRADIEYPLVARYAVGMDECDIIYEFGIDEGYIDAWYVDGNKQDDTITDLATSGKDGVIEERGVGQVIGAEGVITEIYNVGVDAWGVPHYYVAQINTYLAKVTKVTELDPDKHDHVANRTIELTIYVDNVKGPETAADSTPTVKTIKATKIDNDVKYIKNDYVLVRVNKPLYENDKGDDVVITDVTKNPVVTGYLSTGAGVSIVGLAPVVATGTMKDFELADYPYPDMMYIGADKEKHNESAKYFLNWHDADEQDGYNYFGNGLDEKGNLIEGGSIIGQVKKSSPSDYLVIEAMVWNHQGIKGGYASAIMHLGKDGSETEEVVISKINGKPAINGTVETGTFDNDNVNKVGDNVDRNARFYGHLFTYEVNEDGSYNINVTHENSNTPPAIAIPDSNGNNNIIDIGFTYSSGKHTNKYGVITKGEANIIEVTDVTAATWDEHFKARATNETVYMIQNKTGCYDIYIGKDKVPDTIGDICVVTVDNLATLVVATGLYTADKSESTTFLAYVADVTVPTAGGKSFNLKKVDGDGTTDSFQFSAVKVYKLGETKPTTLYLSNNDIHSDINAITAYKSGTNITTTGSVTVDKTGIYQFTISDETSKIITNVLTTVQTGNGSATDASLYDGAGEKDSGKHLATPGNSVAGPDDRTNNSKSFLEFVNVQAALPVTAGTLWTMAAWDWTNGFDDVVAVTGADSSDRNFNVTAATKYIIVTKSDSNNSGHIDYSDVGIVSAGKASDIDASDILTIGYRTEVTSVGRVKLTPVYVYIFKTSTDSADSGKTDTEGKIFVDLDSEGNGSNKVVIYNTANEDIEVDDALALIIDELKEAGYTTIKIDGYSSDTWTFKVKKSVNGVDKPEETYTWKDDGSGYEKQAVIVTYKGATYGLTSSDHNLDDLATAAGETAGKFALVDGEYKAVDTTAVTGNEKSIAFGYYKITPVADKTSAAVIPGADPKVTTGTYTYKTTKTSGTGELAADGNWYLKTGAVLTMEFKNVGAIGTAKTDSIKITAAGTTVGTATIDFVQGTDEGKTKSTTITVGTDNATITIAGENDDT